MKTIQEKINVLNELVQFNNDRIDGYEKATLETDAIDKDLRTLFVKMANDSLSYRKDLAARIVSLGGKVETEGSVSASIHRAWIEFKTAIINNDHDTILSSCEFGENAIVEAYDAVLNDKEDFTPEEIAMIAEQRNALRNSQAAISNYRELTSEIA